MSVIQTLMSSKEMESLLVMKNCDLKSTLIQSMLPIIFKLIGHDCSSFFSPCFSSHSLAQLLLVICLLNRFCRRCLLPTRASLSILHSLEFLFNHEPTCIPLPVQRVAERFRNSGKSRSKLQTCTRFPFRFHSLVMSMDRIKFSGIQLLRSQNHQNKESILIILASLMDSGPFSSVIPR